MARGYPTPTPNGGFRPTSTGSTTGPATDGSAAPTPYGGFWGPAPAYIATGSGTSGYAAAAFHAAPHVATSKADCNQDYTLAHPATSPTGKTS
jgi:hypothetical protein